MAWDRKIQKYYKGKDKQRRTGFEGSSFSKSLEGNPFTSPAKSKPLRKRKRKKHNDSSKENRESRGTFLSKPIGLNRSSYKSSSIEKKPRFSSIFNDSLVLDESAFSKLAKNVRQDLGLQFVNLNNFGSPNYGSKLQSSSSGCLALSAGSSGHVLSSDNRSIPSFNSAPKKSSNEFEVTNLEAKNSFAQFLFKDNISPQILVNTVEKPISPLVLSQSDCGNELCVDIIENTPSPKCSLPKKWSKTFRKRRQAILLTSTPLRGNLSSSSSNNLPSPFESENPKENSGNLINTSDSRNISDLSSWAAVLRACDQSCAIDFSKFIESRGPVTLEKVGEGVFSEVFGCLDRRGSRSVWKVQPFEGDGIFNGEEQKKSTEILSEIYITKALSDLRDGYEFMTDCFVKCLDFKCVYGPYPEVLLKLWQDYDHQKGSENDCPSVFDDQQSMLVTELEYAGLCLEDFHFSTAAQALSIFIQVAHALAAGEMAFQFEHRDLHWGNIMVCRTNAKHMSFTFAFEKRTIETKGVIARIVDYTLSRATVNGRPHFADLALIPDIFESEGEYQFEVYRLMRKHTKNNWNEFTPYTNVLWLHYIALQMCKVVKYKNKRAKIHKENMKTLVSISSTICDYSSASDFVATQTFYPYKSEILIS